MNGSLNIFWNEGYRIVVLANVDPTVAQDAAEYIGDRLEHGRLGCAATRRLAWSIQTAGETPAIRTGEDARAPAERFL